MSAFNLTFPEMPSYQGSWQSIYLEPVIGSGERITIATVAISASGEYKVIQAIGDELLDCLYGTHAIQMQNMIDLIISSLNNCLAEHGRLECWQAPIDGVILGQSSVALDTDLDGILRQAIRFTASLSALALDADRTDDELQPKKYAAQFAANIQEELRRINPSLLNAFNQKVKISQSDILTSFGFLNDRYVANFGLLIPTKMSVSLNSIKAKLFDIESLKKSNYLLMPNKFEVVIGIPALDDPTLSDKAIHRLRSTLEMVEELAFNENIAIYRAENAKSAAQHIIKFAA
ncbi:MAG: hypothetical protein ACI8WB_003626 [Phenylobacterium sp.]|jgi:hypothetical protein